MRDIKFRAYIPETDDFIYFGIGENNFKSYSKQAEQFDVEDVREYEIEQFTGLHDKNGVDIYEGDIVTDGEITGYVEYCNNYACGAYEIMTSESTSVVNENIDNWNDFEVIGNIHQNELIKESK